MSLLWFDAADAPAFGIGTLAEWLDAIDRGEIDPKSEGSIRVEMNGTADLDGGRGLAPLVFLRAGRIAQEKAREVGVGVVRVTNVGGACPLASAVADIGIGPTIGVGQGPGPSWTVAVPTIGTTPAIFSTDLGGVAKNQPTWSIASFPTWSLPFAEEESWLIVAYSVKAFEPLATFHERVNAQLHARPRVDGEIRPDTWQAARSEQVVAGIVLGEGLEATLKERAARAGVAWPTPVEGGSRA